MGLKRSGDIFGGLKRRQRLFSDGSEITGVIFGRGKKSTDTILFIGVKKAGIIFSRGRESGDYSFVVTVFFLMGGGEEGVFYALVGLKRAEIIFVGRKRGGR